MAAEPRRQKIATKTVKKRGVALQAKLRVVERSVELRRVLMSCNGRDGWRKGTVPYPLHVPKIAKNRERDRQRFRQRH